MLAERSGVWELLRGGDEITSHITAKVNQKKKKKSPFLFFVLLSSSSSVRLVTVVSPLTLFHCNLKRGCVLSNVVACLQLTKNGVKQLRLRRASVKVRLLLTLLTFFFFPVSWVSTCSNSLLANQRCISLLCPRPSLSLPRHYLVDHNRFSQCRQSTRKTFTGARAATLFDCRFRHGKAGRRTLKGLK